MATLGDPRRSPPMSPLPATDEAALLRLPMVRELIEENERLLCEAAVSSRLRTMVGVGGPVRLAMEEKTQRSRVALAEADARHALTTQSHASLVAYVAAVEEALAEAQDRNEQLQGYMALAKANLSPLPAEGSDGGAGGAEDVVSRRLSVLLAEKENSYPRGGGAKRGAEAVDGDAQSPVAFKRLRLSSDSSHGRRTQPSPQDITKDRKTLHEADLAVSSPARRKAARPRR